MTTRRKVKTHRARSATARARAIQALLSEYWIPQAAKKCGVSEGELRHWLTDAEDFRAAYSAARLAKYWKTRKANTSAPAPPMTSVDISLLWLALRYRLTGEQVERWQRVVRTALARFDASRSMGSRDASFWIALREELILAGATDRDIQLVAACVVRTLATSAALVPADECDEDENLDNVLDLIAEHLVRADMDVQIGPRLLDTSIDFPERRVH